MPQSMRFASRLSGSHDDENDRKLTHCKRVVKNAEYITQYPGTESSYKENNEKKATRGKKRPAPVLPGWF